MQPSNPKASVRAYLQHSFHLARASYLLAFAAMIAWGQFCANGVAAEPKRPLTLETIPFNGTQAYEYLKQLCDLGPRPSGSEAMKKQQDLIEAHMKKAGGIVTRQSFTIKHPLTNEEVPCVNLIVEWNPKAKERILLCTHYDTRPVPDNDSNPRVRRGGTFIGANDGASGTALLMELASMMPKIESKYGVDFVFFDAEELVYGDGVRERKMGEYFWGSNEFAKNYKEKPPEHVYKMGALLDMVGDKDLQIYQELHSIRDYRSRKVAMQIWGTADRLGVKEFIARPKYEVQDDHLPLMNVAKIPTCDIIDFDYPKHPRNVYWHTPEDTPDKCSALSLAKVGYVISEWLKQAP